jgi:hypothetical protein
MKTRNTIHLTIGAAVVAMGIIGITIAKERTSGSNRVGPNFPSMPSIKCARGNCDYFGMVGITRGQTARLNAYDQSDNSGDATDIPPGPCREVELMFFDSMGNIRQRSTQCLLPGHAVFLDLNGNSVEVPGLRLEIRGLVRFVEDPNLSGPNRITLGSTLEVFDNEAGRTSLVLLPVVQNTWAGR